MSTVIKSSGAVTAREAGLFNLDDVSQRANRYLDTVRQQAAEILAKAQQDAVTIREQAAVHGRQAALEAAQNVLGEKVGKQLTTLVPALKEAIEKIHSAKSDWLVHWEKSAVHVAAAMARRVVRSELTRQPQITTSLVREALELAAGSADIQLRLHPEDYAALTPQIDQLVGELARLGSTKIVADPAISKGGCKVDTAFGSIDQQFEAQLARIEEELN
jgi:flagellar assembly protein FliH